MTTFLLGMITGGASVFLAQWIVLLHYQKRVREEEQKRLHQQDSGFYPPQFTEVEKPRTKTVWDDQYEPRKKPPRNPNSGGEG